MIQRLLYSDHAFSVENFPVTGIIGPRQLGKTTFAKSYPYKKPFIYLDLEKLSDLNKLNDPELYFTSMPNHTINLPGIEVLYIVIYRETCLHWGFPPIRAVADS